MNNKRKKIAPILIVVILLISIGYAFLSTVLNIKTNISLSKVSFTIHFDNVVSLSDNATEDAHITNDDNTEISLSASLTKIGDKYAFTTDIVNDSTLPGIVKSIDLTGISESNMRLIKYKAYYTNNKKEVKVGDYIGPNSTKNITVEITYDLDDSVTNEDISDNTVLLEGTFGIKYENGRLEDYNNSLLSSRLMQGKLYYSSDLIDYSVLDTSLPGGIYLLEETKNDSIPVYFYRGNNNDVLNHVLYAGFCWRIIRTTETGGIKLLYNGLPNGDDQCMNLTGEGTVSEQFNRDYSNSTYDWTSNNVKPLISAWYQGNMVGHDELVEDIPYCNDNDFAVGSPSLQCDPQYEVSVANGKNTYPAAIITADEANMAGYANALDSNQWLFVQLGQLTMTGSTDPSKYWHLHEQGNFWEFGWRSNNKRYLRPVISLVPEAEIASGDGAQTSPYIID